MLTQESSDVFSRRNFLKLSLLTASEIALDKVSFAHDSTNYAHLRIAKVSQLVRQKKVSPVELTKECLARIERLNPKINAFITVTFEQALQEAKTAEIEIMKGRWKGALHGIPIALKDNIDTAGVRTTAASGVYKDRVPDQDAEVVKKLKIAGAILLGKLNLHEFALGTTSVISYFGAVRNPWNTDYIAGGSSGGSAAAVAAGFCYAAIGTDTGGSIRLPAACCGLTGFKPSYGLISIRGIIPVIQSIDHAGPICRTVEDVAILLNTLASLVPTPFNCQINYHSSFNKIRNPRIGIAKNYKASDEVNAVFRAAILAFQLLGSQTREIELPTLPSSVIADAEIGGYHRRLLDQYKDLYNPVTFNDINSIKQPDNIDYIRDKNKLEETRATISESLFKDIDVLILPTTTSMPPTIEEAKAQGPFALEDLNTDKFNTFGLPAISIPCGFSKNGLPVGLQIVGPRWGERKVLDIAQKYQQLTNWHLKHSNLE